MKEFTLGYSAEALVSAFWKNTIYLCSAVSCDIITNAPR